MTMIAGKVLEKTELTDRITAFAIGAEDGSGLPGWTPGAHVDVALPGSERSYSLIAFDTIPDEPDRYLITVQREDTGKGGSRAMHRLEVGSSLPFTAPKNDFPLDTSNPAVLLAGGIGVTPMISMAAALKAAGQSFAFHYAGRSASVMAYAEEVRGFGGEIHCDDAPTALDLDKVIAAVGEAHLYICGPRAMIHAAKDKAEAAGIPPERIHVELFDGAGSLEGDKPFEVELNDGSVHAVPAGKSIIEVLEMADVDVMYDCARGDCGICQVDVLEGVPDHRDVVLSEAERASGEVIQICVSRSKTPRLKLDI